MKKTLFLIALISSFIATKTYALAQSATDNYGLVADVSFPISLQIVKPASIPHNIPGNTPKETIYGTLNISFGPTPVPTGINPCVGMPDPRKWEPWIELRVEKLDGKGYWSEIGSIALTKNDPLVKITPGYQSQTISASIPLASLELGSLKTIPSGRLRFEAIGYRGYPNIEYAQVIYNDAIHTQTSHSPKIYATIFKDIPRASWIVSGKQVFTITYYTKSYVAADMKKKRAELEKAAVANINTHINELKKTFPSLYLKPLGTPVANNLTATVTVPLEPTLIGGTVAPIFPRMATKWVTTAYGSYLLQETVAPTITKNTQK